MKKFCCTLASILFVATIFVSCDNKTEVVLSGETSDVQVGMSIIGDASSVSSQNASQYAPADDVYFENTNNVGISDIFVVPIVDRNVMNVQKPVSLNNILPNEMRSTTATNLSVLRETNRFLVYANVGANTDVNASFDVNANFDIASDAMFVANEIQNGVADGIYSPHGVYLFADGRASNQNLYVTEKDDATDWYDVLDWTPFTDAAVLGINTTGNTYNRIKISDVTYAVGSLAAAARHGEYKSTQKMWLGGVEMPLTAEMLNANVRLVGITIQNQPKAFNALMVPQYNSLITVYEPTCDSTIKAYSDGRMEFATAREMANTFVSLAQSQANEDIIFNLVFENKGGSAIQFKEGGYSFTPGQNFFLSSKMLSAKATETGGLVFKTGYTTLLNAIIEDWTKATPDIQVNVDVEIGISVDLQWKEGHVYEEKI